MFNPMMIDALSEEVFISHMQELVSQECCASCGAQNRWWVSRKGYASQEYINWIETGLCPKCLDPKEEKMAYSYFVTCAWCSETMDIKHTDLPIENESHSICKPCADQMIKDLDQSCVIEAQCIDDLNNVYSDEIETCVCGSTKNLSHDLICQDCEDRYCQ